MRNLAGHPESSEICAAELAAAGIPVEKLPQPCGEPRSLIGGSLGGFTFRRAWVYWSVKGAMSRTLAHELNTTPRGSDLGTKYSGGGKTWGDVIRVEGFAGGTNVSAGGCSSWHIDTEDGLAKFADFIREKIR